MEVSVSFLGDYNYPKIIDKLNNSDCDYIHYDVMDGKFVDNKNLTVKELKDLVGISKKKVDVHLMVNDPTKYIDALALYNISYITVHKEIKNYKKYIEMIKNYGFKAGLAINPETSAYDILEDLPYINMVVVMGVNPGKSGQSFIPSTIEKIEDLKKLRKENNLSFKISVDGGINDTVLESISPDIIVSASFMLNNLDRINEIKSRC